MNCSDPSNPEKVERREFFSTTPFAAFDVGHAFNWDRGVIYQIISVAHAVGVAFQGKPEAKQTHFVTVLMDTDSPM